MIGFLLNNNLAPIGSSVISTCSPADLFEQRQRNVPLASADVRGGGILRDEPKERLRRRLDCEQSLFSSKIRGEERKTSSRANVPGVGHGLDVCGPEGSDVRYVE